MNANSIEMHRDAAALEMVMREQQRQKAKDREMGRSVTACLAELEAMFTPSATELISASFLQ